MAFSGMRLRVLDFSPVSLTGRRFAWSLIISFLSGGADA